MPLLLPELLCPAGDEAALRAAAWRYLGLFAGGGLALAVVSLVMSQAALAPVPAPPTLTRRRWKRPCAMRICTMCACM